MSVYSKPILPAKYNNMVIVLVLAIITGMAYWPISFHLFSLKNDALNYFLPVRYQISDAINHGEFPAWSPYFNLGYALHADSQSGVWNPIVWLFSINGPYTLFKLQLETLVYIYLSGVGMYFLCKGQQLNIFSSLIAAISFMLCGFNSDAAQFLNWISGAAFLPFIVHFYLQFLKNATIKNALLTSLFLWLMLVSAYPAEFILTVYFLGALFIGHLYNRPQKDKFFYKKYITQHLLLCFAFLLLSLPAILSYIPYLPLSVRGSGASFEEAMSNPLHPSLLLSYITPLYIWNNPTVDITDALERNSYIGILCFILMLGSFFTKSMSKWEKCCKWGFLFSLLFSLGDVAFIRPLTYYVLPLMDSFRHPAMAKVFTIFFGTQLAAFYFQKLQITKQYFLLHQKILIGTSLFLVTLYIAAALNNDQWHLFIKNIFKSADLKNDPESLKTLKDQFNYWTLLQISVLLQIPFLLFHFFIISKKGKPLLIVVNNTINCMVFVSIFCFFTVVKKDSATYIQTLIDQEVQHGFPIPSLSNSLEENSKDGMRLFDEIGPLNMYNKKIGRVDYRISPCNLQSQINYWDSSYIKSFIHQYPLIYAADSAIHLTHQNQLPLNASSKKLLFTTDTSLLNFVNQNNHPNNKCNIKINLFHPNQFNLSITNSSPAFIVLQQNYYPNWKMYIDGKHSTIEPVNITFMGFRLPAGEHQISFKYDLKYLFISMAISALTLLGILIIISKKITKGH